MAGHTVRSRYPFLFLPEPTSDQPQQQQTSMTDSLTNHNPYHIDQYHQRQKQQQHNHYQQVQPSQNYHDSHSSSVSASDSCRHNNVNGMQPTFIQQHHQQSAPHHHHHHLPPQSPYPNLTPASLDAVISHYSPQFDLQTICRTYQDQYKQFLSSSRSQLFRFEIENVEFADFTLSSSICDPVAMANGLQQITSISHRQHNNNNNNSNNRPQSISTIPETLVIQYFEVMAFMGYCQVIATKHYNQHLKYRVWHYHQRDGSDIQTLAASTRPVSS